VRKSVKWIALGFLLIYGSANKPAPANSIPPAKNVMLSSEWSEDRESLSPAFANCASPNSEYGRYFRFIKEKSVSMKRSFRDFYGKDKVFFTETQAKFKKEKSSASDFVKIFHYTEKLAPKQTVEAYYFDKKNSIIGYLRIKREYVMQDRSYSLSCTGEDTYWKEIKASIRKMTSLPLTRISLPGSGENLELYALNHDGYTEQYGFIRHEGHLYWVLDGFYPDDFEKEYTRKAVKSIDTFIDKKRWLFPEPEDYKVD
jgi:hypothetical protein